MSTTLSVLDRGKGSGTRRARLYLVLEACRPASGSARWSLETVEEVRIGRAGARQGQRLERAGVVTLELGVPDPQMSATHVRIARVGGRWVLQDLRSKNGTRVNGAQASKAVLQSGDRFELGGTHFQYFEGVESEDDAGDLDAESLLDRPVGLATVIPAVARSMSHLESVARSTVPVVLLGESGTGKELVARAVHLLSGRKGRFVAVNCGALPQSLVESELFGSRRGAFTGATEDRIGVLRSAHGGTLLLDEVGDLPAPAQAALLRVLQDRQVVPVGDAIPVSVDFRVLSATHRNLGEMAAAGQFRSDLWARLRGLEVEVPPLRARGPDLGLIVANLLRKLTGRRQASVSLDIETARALVHYAWPLNIRELEQALSVALELSKGRAIELDHLPPEVRAASATRPVARPLTEGDATLRERLVALLGEHGGNLSAVARCLGKDRKQVRRWIQRFGIRVEPGPDPVE